MGSSLLIWHFDSNLLPSAGFDNYLFVNSQGNATEFASLGCYDFSSVHTLSDLDKLCGSTLYYKIKAGVVHRYSGWDLHRGPRSIGGSRLLVRVINTDARLPVYQTDSAQ